MITLEQLEARIACDGCGKDCAADGTPICPEDGSPDGEAIAYQMLTLIAERDVAIAEAYLRREEQYRTQAEVQRLTERNTALEAGLWMMCEEAAGHYLHSQGYAMPKCSETGGCSEPEDFDCQHHCSKARRANAWYRAAMLHAVALCAGSIRNGKARSHRW